MRRTISQSTRRTASLTLSLLLTLGGATWAKQGGNGGGGGGGRGNGNGGGITPAKITFADELGLEGSRISGDNFGEYVHGEDRLEVYLGSGGAQGDIFFRLGNSSRGIWLDFGACHPDETSCTPPYEAMVDLYTSISVAPGDVINSGDGLFGMREGDTIEAPMEVFYSYTGEQSPGFIHFDSALRGNNPCKNKSFLVSIHRPGLEEVWTVSAEEGALACARLPGGGFSGQYEMPFVFTIETLP